MSIFVCASVSKHLLRSLSYAFISSKYSIHFLKTPLIALSNSKTIKRSLIMPKFTFSSVDQLTVEHNMPNTEFYIKLGDDKAMLNYSHVSRGTIDLYHTEVPQSLQGRGIAKLLAEKAFDYAADNNLKTRVTCTYLQKYLKENPKEKYLKNVVK